MTEFSDQYALVEQRRRHFDALVSTARAMVRRGQFGRACLVAEIAAYYASAHHGGRFASAPLEEALRRIGDAELPPGASRREQVASPRHVLHVLTEAHAFGGATRGVRRWIQLDTGRRHSVAITHQTTHRIPEDLERATSESGGALHVLDRGGRQTVERARRLRETAASADFVVLQPHSRDIVPMLAFSREASSPAVGRVDLADHVFWLDVSISNAIFGMRDAALLMAERRRGVPAERCAIVPIPLTPVERTLSRREAKARIGIREDHVVLLTIATAYKYVTSRPPGLAEVLEPLLRAHPDLVLIAIGPDNTGLWRAVAERTHGRVRALGGRTDTAEFYQAADIYLDSFPFASNTSMLEAGSYEVPVVSYSPYRAHERVLGPGQPGLNEALIEAADLHQYVAVIEALVNDPDRRERIGQRGRARILAEHSGDGWRRRVHAAYSQALTAGRSDFVGPEQPEPIEPVDLAVSWILEQAGAVDLRYIVEVVARSVPLSRRLPVLWAVWKATGELPRGAALPAPVEQAVHAFRGWAGRGYK
jgi:hypothetical protein